MPDYSSPDFSSLGDLANIYRQSQQRAQREQVLKGLGQGAGPLDYGSAAKQLLAAGDTEGGLSLAKLAQQQFLSSPEHITQTETARARVAEQFAPKTVNIKLADGTEVTAQKSATGYEIPQIRGMPAPDPNAPQPPPGVDVKKWREQRATQLGNIDDKAVLEADKAVEAGTNAVQSLTKALALNKTAHAGPLAGKAGYVGSLFGHQPSIDTEVLSNTVTNQALENLRATFGGNPTEGERKILLDVQGAVTQAEPVRREIYQNALEAAQRRIAFNKQNAEQMRGGKYLLPEGQRNPQQPAAAPQQPQAASDTWKNKETITAARANPQQAISDAQAVIAKNPATRDQVIQRLRAVGIDPSPLMGAPTAPDATGRAIY